MSTICALHLARQKELTKQYHKHPNGQDKEIELTVFVLEGLLHFACCENHTQKAIRYLKLKATGDVQAYWYEHMTYAQSASDALVLSGRSDTFGILITYGLKAPRYERFNRSVSVTNWDHVVLRPSQLQAAIYGGDVLMLQFLLARGVDVDADDLRWAYADSMIGRTKARTCDSWIYLLKANYSILLRCFPTICPLYAKFQKYQTITWNVLDHAMVYGDMNHLRSLFASSTYNLDTRLCEIKLEAKKKNDRMATLDWSQEACALLADALQPWSPVRKKWFNSLYNSKAEQARRALCYCGLFDEDCHFQIFSHIRRFQF